jgi:hypothetical protein
MVTGEPGSGKTSLGLQLAASLRVPFLSRDHIRGGLLATAGLWTNRLRDPAPPREAAIEAFVAVVETLAAQGVTSVVEFVVTPQRLEAFRRLQVATSCMVIFTRAADARARADRRDRDDPFLRRPEVLDALGLRSVDDYVRAPERDVVRDTMQSDFGDLPLLGVATDDGYDPPLAAIVDRTRS